MATKAIAEQFKVFVFERPNTINDDTVGGTPGNNTPYDAAADTLIIASGSYNRPAQAGDTIYTSQNAAVSAGIAAVRRMQQGLGGNARFQVNGQPCGPDQANSEHTLTADERRERVYVMGDTISAGLYDAIRYANRVPNAANIRIRTQAGPEVPVEGVAAAAA